jgi:hypothetical protein
MGGAPWAVHHGRCGSELCREPSPLCRKLSLGLHVEMARPPTFPYRSASDDGMAVGYRECRRARESGVIDRMGRVSLGVGSRLQTCTAVCVYGIVGRLSSHGMSSVPSSFMCRVAMDAACAHLVLVLPGTRFALVVGSLTFRRPAGRARRSACRSDPDTREPARGGRSRICNFAPRPAPRIIILNWSTVPCTAGSKCPESMS